MNTKLDGHANGANTRCAGIFKNVYGVVVVKDFCNRKEKGCWEVMPLRSVNVGIGKNRATSSFVDSRDPSSQSQASSFKATK